VLPSAAVLDELFARSEGNAFFAEELLSAAGTENAGRLPRSLRDATLVRVERLPARAQEILRVVAVAGWRVDSRLLSATAGISEQELAATLREVHHQPADHPRGRRAHARPARRARAMLGR
jgi:predicted ATPase